MKNDKVCKEDPPDRRKKGGFQLRGRTKKRDQLITDNTGEMTLVFPCFSPSLLERTINKLNQM